MGLPAYRLHIPPLGRFRGINIPYGSSLPTSASFIRFGCCRRFACRSIKEDISRRYPFILSFTLTVLLRKSNSWLYMVFALLYNMIHKLEFVEVSFLENWISIFFWLPFHYIFLAERNSYHVNLHIYPTKRRK